MFENLELKQIMNVLLAIVIASSIIILITMNITDPNGLSALIGGYSGLFMGMFFTMVVHLVFTKTTYLDMLPIVMIIVITGLLVYYLSKYFGKISSGNVSNYYSGFSLLSAILLFTQIIIVFHSMYNSTEEPRTKLFKDTTFSLLGLFSVLNMISVLTLGVILHFYTTQG